MGDCNIYGGFAGGGGSAIWGGILGDIQNQSDLMSLLRDKGKIFEATIGATWTEKTPGGYSQIISVKGITAEHNPVVDIILDDDVDTAKEQIEAWTCVSRITTGNDFITVYCYEEKPSVEINIQLLCVSGLDADILDPSKFATDEQGIKADAAIQGIKGNGILISPDGEMIVNIIATDVGAASSSHTHSNATTSVAGFLSTGDKTKLNSIAEGATKNIITYGTAAPSGGSTGDLYFRYS